MTAGLVLVSHCLLNPDTTIGGGRPRPDLYGAVVRTLLDAGASVLQLPCPEFTSAGAFRWAQSKEQYDQPFFRKHCRGLLQPVVDQLLEHRRQDLPVLGFIGIEGSPTCGVHITTRADYGGRLEGADGLPLPLPPSRKVPESGVMVEELRRALDAAGFDLPMIAVPRTAESPKTVEAFLRAVKDLVP